MSSPCPRPSGVQAKLALLAATLVLAGTTASWCAAPNNPTPEPGALGTATTTLFPGGGSAPAPSPNVARYQGNPQAIAEGERLYTWYNCVGCHFHGAGGMGPALMDQQWIYGGSLDQIHATLVQGRPNGMPSWAGKIPDDDLWKIAAYVKSMSAPNTAVGPGQVMPTPPPPEAPAAGGTQSSAPREPASDH